MKACRLAILLPIVAGAELVQGCAATHQHAVIKPIATAFQRTSVFLVEVNCGAATPEEAARLAQEVATKLSATSKFEQVEVKENGSQRADFLIFCKITDVNRVSSGERAFLGALAGQASLHVNVRIVLISTGEVIGEANVIGNSSGGTIFSGTTPQAIAEAAEGIVKFVAAQ